jgi:hypothetical protein
MVYEVPTKLLHATFDYFRRCGCGKTECQVVWTSPWDSIDLLDEAVHPKHESHLGGFSVDDKWLHSFWLDLAARKTGVRVQVHTHPGAAFHSPTDDAYPMIHTPGFLSLVIPRFGMGAIGLSGAYLTELGPDGEWHEVLPTSRLKIVE